MVGILYVAVIVLWLVIEATPREPIGDPYLAVMEGLTIVSALALVGLTMIFAALALVGNSKGRYARQALLIGGVFCVVGVVGPISGLMILQNVAVLGYAFALPIAAGLIAHMFIGAVSSPRVAVQQANDVRSGGSS